MISVTLALFAFLHFVSSAEVDYSACGTTKVCLYLPRSCSANPSTCDATVTYMKAEGQMIGVEMTAKKDNPEQDVYTAIGFSEDNRMGEDYVVHCTSNNPTKVTAAQNPKPEPGRYAPTMNLKTTAEVASDVQSEIMNNVFICRFKLSTEIPSEFTKFNSINEPLTILLATGPSNGPGQVGKHRSKTLSQEKINLSQKLENTGTVTRGEAEPEVHAENKPDTHDGNQTGEPEPETESEPSGASPVLLSATLVFSSLCLFLLSH